jgi:zinc/manganese transport system substrate-binding protein
MKKQLLSALLLLGAISAFPALAKDKLKVLTTIQTFASVAKEIGGSNIEVASLSKGDQDPHFIDAKPSLSVMVDKADIIIYAGLDLEVGWLPKLLTAATNSKVAAGADGNFDASKYIKITDVVTNADRSMGDIHPAGNPHYFTDPNQMLKVAKAMSERFAKIDSANAATYKKNYTTFETKITKKIPEWEKKMAPYKGAKVVTFHRSWTYMLNWLQLTPDGYVEPKPGITPDPKYLASLVSTMKADSVKVVIAESYYNPKVAKLVAEKAGAKYLSMPANVGGTKTATDYVTLIDELVNQLETNLK